MFGLLLPDNVCETQAQLTAQLNSFVPSTGEGGLTWEIEKPSKAITFFDLSLWIDECGCIQSKTYQKPMNWHLYLTWTSIHPRSVCAKISSMGC
jgi:hypothetical protein